jgi:hypothetical protein
MRDRQRIHAEERLPRPAGLLPNGSRSFLNARSAPKIGIRRNQDTIFIGGKGKNMRIACCLQAVIPDVACVMPGASQPIP